MTDYPIQTGANCVAYSYWVAMRIALKQADPYRKFTITPAEVESITGAPCPVTGETVQKLSHFADFNFNTLPFGEDGMPLKVLPTGNPIVVSNWQYGYSHAFCLLLLAGSTSATAIAYDPGRGDTVIAQLDMCAGHTVVTCGSPESFPYKAWYWKFKIVRDLFGKFV